MPAKVGAGNDIQEGQRLRLDPQRMLARQNSAACAARVAAAHPTLHSTTRPAPNPLKGRAWTRSACSRARAASYALRSSPACAAARASSPCSAAMCACAAAYCWLPATCAPSATAACSSRSSLARPRTAVLRGLRSQPLHYPWASRSHIRRPISVYSPLHCMHTSPLAAELKRVSLVRVQAEYALSFQHRGEIGNSANMH